MQKNKLTRRILSNYQLYLFLAVPMFFILLFAYAPMGGIVLAFKQYNIRKGIWGSPWVGLKYFRRFFESYQFGRVIKNTLSLSFYSLFASFPVPILFALVLNAVPFPRYRKVVQTVTYMPHFISTVVMVGLLMQIFNARIGAFGVIWKAFTGKMAPDLFGMPKTFAHLYVWSGVWQSTGWSSVIYFAALSGVDKELHEAAEIDGATRFQRVLHIDLPCILPTASIMLIMAVGGIMNSNTDLILLLYTSATYETADVIGTYIYRVGIQGGKFSQTAAIGLFATIVNFFLVFVANQLSNKISGTGLW